MLPVLLLVLADLVVTPNFDASKWISATGQPIELRLSEPVGTRVAVFAGKRDVTPLFENAGTVIRYRTGVPPLPAGEQELILYSIPESGPWVEIGRYPIRILTRRGFEKASVKPSVDLTNKGQLANEQIPVDPFSRGEFQDLTAQGTINTELQRGNFAFRTQANVTGVSYRNEALRFGSEGESAPLVDLAAYRVDFEKGIFKLGVGHVGFGSHRHLASGFASRGAVLTIGAGRAVDLSFGIANGTAIVGWDNFFGVDEREHRVTNATVGFELIPSRPGGARLELAVLEGSLQPRNGFADAGVRSAERSRGGGARLILAHPSQRFTLDGGWTRSRYTPQHDAELEANLGVAAIPETERDAAYLDATLAIVQNKKLGSQPVGLSATLTIERVEPLYRSVPASLQSDVLRGGVTLSGNYGPLVVQASTLRIEDNLEDIRSLLKTKTEQNNANVSLALGSVFGARRGARWIPMLTIGANSTHQYGAWLPINSGFAESHVPDQYSNNYQASLEWQVAPFRFGLRGGLTDQDNRQPGRALSDFVTNTGSAFLGYAFTDRLDLGYELALDEQKNFEFSTSERNRRHGVTLAWKLIGDVALAGNYSQSLGRDGARTNERTAADSFIELSTGFRLWHSPVQQNRSRVFVRYSNRESRTVDHVFGGNNDNRGWSMTSGVNFSVY